MFQNDTNDFQYARFAANLSAQLHKIKNNNPHFDIAAIEDFYVYQLCNYNCFDDSPLGKSLFQELIEVLKTHRKKLPVVLLIIISDLALGIDSEKYSRIAKDCYLEIISRESSENNLDMSWAAQASYLLTVILQGEIIENGSHFAASTLNNLYKSLMILYGRAYYYGMNCTEKNFADKSIIKIKKIIDERKYDRATILDIAANSNWPGDLTNQVVPELKLTTTTPTPSEPLTPAAGKDEDIFKDLPWPIRSIGNLLNSLDKPYENNSSNIQQPDPHRLAPPSAPPAPVLPPMRAEEKSDKRANNDERIAKFKAESSELQGILQQQLTLFGQRSDAVNKLAQRTTQLSASSEQLKARAAALRARLGGQSYAAEQPTSNNDNKRTQKARSSRPA